MWFLGVNLALFALTGYFVYDFVKGYRASVGSVWARMLEACKDSATVLWARFTVVSTGMVSALVWVADLLNAPGVSAAITTYLKPSVVAGIMVTIAIITELARKRSL